MEGFNKKIWFLWFQGKSDMPEVVKMCYDSWLVHNPNWELILLNDQNLSEYINLNEIIPDLNKNISLQGLSNIIRINLLKKFGGVWADSTCFCTKPLDSWIENKLESGFFAFARPGRDRMLSSWFFVAKPENKLVAIYCEEVNEFWRKNPEIKQLSPKLKSFLLKTKINALFLRKPTLWHTAFFLKVLKIHPYHWFHYLFEVIYKKNKVFKKIWDESFVFSADNPHKLLFFGLNEPISPELKNEIDSKEVPVYKLTWRIDFNSNDKNSVYNYLKKIGKQ